MCITTTTTAQAVSRFPRLTAARELAVTPSAVTASRWADLSGSGLPRLGPRNLRRGLRAEGFRVDLLVGDDRLGNVSNLYRQVTTL
jgi:hypothetical protein